MNLSRLAALLVLIAGVVLAVYFILDATPAAWLVRLSWAGAITAGFAAVLFAAVRTVENRGAP